MVTCTFAGLIAELGSRGGSCGDSSPLVELPLVVDLLAQCPSLLGRQLTQVFLAFTQAQPLQWPDLLHLQHTIANNSDTVEYGAREAIVLRSSIDPRTS